MASASQKKSSSIVVTIPFEKNLSKVMLDSMNRYALNEGLANVKSFAAENVFFTTSKTVDNWLKSSSFDYNKVLDWLRRSGDKILAAQLKAQIDEAANGHSQSENQENR